MLEELVGSPPKTYLSYRGLDMRLGGRMLLRNLPSKRCAFIYTLDLANPRFRLL